MIKKILEAYELKEANLKYEKAKDLLSLITDEEFEEIITSNAETFAIITQISTESDKVKYVNEIEKAIELFIQCIESRGLTRDEYDAMTTDDIIDYLRSIYDKDSVDLYQIIQLIEQHK